MDFDFHYYGTLSAAKFAGYSVDDARKIAIAAQFVDEFTYRHFDGKLQSPKYAAFDFDKTGMIDQGTSFDKYLASIWIPFHFLPSLGENLGITVGSENSSFGPVAVNGGLDLLNRGCITLPSGELYNKVKGLEGVKQNDYMAIGLKMHVLADTFAHQGFVGYRKADVNGVDKLVYDGKDDTSPTLLSKMGAIGHAAAGHYPDFGYADYEYVAGWQADKTKLIKRNNPEIFADAYIAMVESMSAFRTGSVINKEVLVQRRGDILAMLSNIPNDDFQEEYWVDFLDMYDDIHYQVELNKSIQEVITDHKQSVVAYFKDSNNLGNLIRFNLASHEHYTMVSETMKNKLDCSLEEFPYYA